MDNAVTNSSKCQLAGELEQSLAAVFESKMVVVQKPSRIHPEETEAPALPVKDVPSTIETVKPDNTITLRGSGGQNIITEEGNDLRQDFGGEEATPSSTAENREEPAMRKPTDQDSDSLTPTMSTTEETMAEELYGEEQQQEETAGEAQEDAAAELQESSGGQTHDALDTLTKTEVVEELQKEKPAPMEPLKMLKKGAVAAVGGTMVGVGLVMIPLPTPFGAVVASSGLAVLGTEFDSAREMNETLVKKTKENLESARDHVIRSIESMESVSEDEDDDDEDETERSEEDDSPEWLHMNPKERKRQLKMAQEKYRKETQTRWDETSEYITRSTGNFLTKTVLPFLKRTKESSNPPPTEEGQQATSVDGEVLSTPGGVHGDESASKPQDIIEDSVLVVRSDDSIAGAAVDIASTNDTAEEVMIVAPIETEDSKLGRSGDVPILDAI